MSQGVKVDVDGIASGIVAAAIFLFGIAAFSKACDDWEDDCLDRVKATVHGKAPDGTPAEIQSSWCGKYKPGREPAGH
jgi:hypothetical protein